MLVTAGGILAQASAASASLRSREEGSKWESIVQGSLCTLAEKPNPYFVLNGGLLHHERLATSFSGFVEPPPQPQGEVKLYRWGKRKMRGEGKMGGRGTCRQARKQNPISDHGCLETSRAHATSMPCQVSIPDSPPAQADENSEKQAQCTRRNTFSSSRLVWHRPSPFVTGGKAFSRPCLFRGGRRA